MHKQFFKMFIQTVGLFTLTMVTEIQGYEEHLTYDTHVGSDMLDTHHLTLEDGSEWEASEFDLAELRSWFSHSAIAPIVITPNYSLTRNHYGYYLTHEGTGAYVQANLIGTPQVENPNSVKIVGLEKSSLDRGCICLSNGTFWCVASSDVKLLKNWHTEDLVIIGKNTEWFSYETHILINIPSHTFVRVQRI